MPELPNWVKATVHFFKADWDELYQKLIKKETGEIIDDHPLKGYLIVLRVVKTLKKKSILDVGSSKYLLIDKKIAEKINDNNKNLPMFGYSDINHHDYLVVDCGRRKKEVNANE